MEKSKSTRRQVLTLLAAGPLLGISDRARAAESHAAIASGKDPVDDVGTDLPRRVANGEVISTLGTYRGNTTVEFLYSGERRSVQSGAVVQLDEPIEHEDLNETNPFNLFIGTTPSISEAGGAYEGMYYVNSAGVYFQGASAPGIDYTPPDTWMEQHWELSFNNGQLAGSLTSTNSSVSNSMWYAYPESSTDIGYGPPIEFDAGVASTGFRVGTTIEGIINEGRFTASITGSTPRIDAFEITVNAERPQL